MADSPYFIYPQWPAPSHIKAFVTTRKMRSDGVSVSELGFNLASHVKDNPQNVARNRHILAGFLPKTSSFWLQQTHSSQVIRLPCDGELLADAAWTEQSSQVCAVLTADCLPLLLCDQAGSYVAAVHAGWRGLVNGILAQTVKSAPVPVETLLVWLGPAISQKAYEVGEDVRVQLLGLNPLFEKALVAGKDDIHWQLDLYEVARIQCRQLGIRYIFGGDYCTYSQDSDFYSFRRQGVTGRMASLIWKTS